MSYRKIFRYKRKERGMGYETGLFQDSSHHHIHTTALLFHHMGGTFHYIFNHEHTHKPLRYPERLIDTYIMLYEEKMIGRKKRQ